MSQIDELLENARAYPGAFDGGDLPSAPARKVAVVTCMDARIDPYALLGLSKGDAHVIRNAGGVVNDDVIRSLAISQRMLGTSEVALIQHTSCGLLTFTDEEFADGLESDTGERPEWSAGAFSDLEQSVRDGLFRIEASPFVPRSDGLRGFVYDVETGELRELDRSP